nr:peptidase MA family metallohydrolase [Desulfofundulus thermobenzoicus]
MGVKLLALVVLLTLMLCLRLSGQLRGYLYGVFREMARAQVMLSTRHWLTLSSPHFIVRYQPEDAGSARLVLKTAERFYEPVFRDFPVAPSGKIPLIIHPSRESLNAAFGWPASESAMGVYWAGVIRILSPADWVEAKDPAQVEEIFVSAGPVAHELTHLVVDYQARGNVPRWFTEGLAQYEEYKLTGFRFSAVPEDLSDRPPYSFTAMDRDFDRLPDQNLAYRQSFSAVEYLVAVYGEKSLHTILTKLGQGWDMERALQAVTGLDLEGFTTAWRQWAGQNQTPQNPRVAGKSNFEAGIAVR